MTEKLRELVITWKLRLVVSALWSIMGLSVLIGYLSGIIMDNFDTMDQTIVGVAVFILVIPVYLIAADLPKIDEFAIAELLKIKVPELDNNIDLFMKPDSELNDHEKEQLEIIENKLSNYELIGFLPNRPVKQAIFLLITCGLLTTGLHLYFS